MKDLPIGLQTFKRLRQENFIYVDKTEYIYALARRSGYYFLSRPRRFGKSLLINTFKELFLGNKLLFEGLWIAQKWDWTQKTPVIHFSFDALDYRNLGLEKAIDAELRILSSRYDIVLERETMKSRFQELLFKVSEKYGSIALLIDEYDKPIIDYLECDEKAKAKENQAILRQFYAILKSSEDYLRFVFITGVSKFSRISIFSDLNHLSDLSMHPDFAGIVGYTQTELEHHFAEYIAETQKTLNISKIELLEQIKKWYNGYSWDGKTTLYNPFGILNFFNKKQFGNFWFSSGIPHFLFKLMKEKGVFKLENTTISSTKLESFDLDNLDIIALCHQTGYLTIKNINPFSNEIVLDFPNQEVQESIYQFMIDSLSQNKNDIAVSSMHLLKAFQTANFKQIQDIISALLSDLPSTVYDKESEGLYHGLLHLVFQLLGIYVRSEVNSAQGRADSVVETENHIFIFEFKFNQTAKLALKQIKNRKYADKYKATQKQIVAIGVNFKSQNRDEIDWIFEKLN